MYDDFNRLATANNSSPTQGFSYAYDELGNRWQQNLTTGSGLTSSLTFSNYSSATTNGNCYHAAGRTNQPDGYCYDAAGNLLTDGTHSYTYDAENRIISVDGGQTATYTYDGDGRRIRKVSSAGTVNYLYNLEDQSIAEFDDSGTFIRGEIYAHSRHLATYQSGTTYFNQEDWLGTERSRLALNGSQCENITSLAFGDDQATAGSCGDPSPNHFTGKERDSETGLDYFGARYYSNGLGRFITPDWAAKATAVPYAEFADPQSLNLYSYVRNVPTARFDPDGHLTDYYSTEGKRLGSDCINNGAVAITKYGVDKMSDGTVDAITTCAVGCTTIEQSTGAAIQASVDRTMQPSAGDTKGGFHEEGFTQDKDGTIHNAQPGPAARPGDTEAHVTQTITSNTAIVEHTHPAGTQSGGGTVTIGGQQFDPKPSPTDRRNAGNTPAIGQQITHIEASAGDRTVYFYDNTGVYAHVPLDAFPQ